MTKVKTNILEMLLKDFLLGKKFYDNENNLRIIDDVNFQPLIETVYVKSGDDGFYFSLNEMYYFEIEDNKIKQNNNRIVPNKGKIKNIR